MIRLNQQGGSSGLIGLLNTELTPGWTKKAVCANEKVDPELFFPAPGTHGSHINKARKYCRRCPVTKECEINGQWQDGIWGGKTEIERRTFSTRNWHDTLSLTRCNYPGCQNLLVQKPKGPRRYFCCRIHRDRTRAKPRPLPAFTAGYKEGED